MFGWNTTAQNAHFDMTERSGAYDGVSVSMATGLIAGTRIASHMGWRPVEAIAPGDLVLTFDNGMQKVTHVQRATFVVNKYANPDVSVPVVVPAGTLGNTADVTLLPEQGVLVESDAALDAHGDPFAVITSSALNGFRGAYRAVNADVVEVISIHFDAAQVVYVNGGLLAHCPQANLALTDMLDLSGSAYDVLEGRDAKFLVECMQLEDQSAQTMSYAA